MAETRAAESDLRRPRSRTSSSVSDFRASHPHHAVGGGRTTYLLLPCASRSTVKRAIKHAWVFVKNAFALLSAIVAWLGVWEIFDLYLFERTILRDCLYVLGSAFVMAITSTYLPNCGIYEDDKAMVDATEAAFASADDWESTLGPSPEVPQLTAMVDSPPLTAESDDTLVGRQEMSPRVALGHYAAQDRLIEMTPSPSDLALPHSASDLSIDLRPHDRRGASSSAADQDDADAMLVADAHTESYSRACWFLSTQLCTLDIFVRVYCASIVALFASICFWAGSYNLLMQLFLAVSGDREWLCYVLNLVLGWALMCSTGTLFQQAGLTEDETEPLESKGTTSPREAAGEETLVVVLAPVTRRAWLPPRVHVYLRASLAITGSMMFWLGTQGGLELWSQMYYTHDETAAAGSAAAGSERTLHCTACVDSTPTRNGIFVLLGVVLFVITDTMAIHAGVEESIQSVAPEMTAAQHHHLQHDQEQDATGASSSSLPVDQHRLVSVGDSESGDPSSTLGASSSPRTGCACLLSHPLVRHLRALASLTGVMLLWEGVWDAAFNAEAESRGWERMVVYTAVGLIGLMLTNSLFSNSGVLPPFAIAARSTQVQQRLGFHLQEKHFLSAAAGGQAHDIDLLPLPSTTRDAQRTPEDEGRMSPSASSPLSFRTLRHPSPQPPSNGTAPAGTTESPVPTPPLDASQALQDSKSPFRAMD